MTNMQHTDVILMTIPNNMDKVVGWGAKFVTPLAPYGLMYLVSSLREAHISCTIVDCYAEGFGIQEALKVVGRTTPNIIGLSIMTSQAFVACELIKQLRQQHPQVKIVLGNIHADVFADWFLSKGFADAVVHGEGEHTFTELCQVYLSGGDPGVVRGISYVTPDGIIEKTPTRPLFQDLDKVPIPIWDELPHHRYRFPLYFHPPGVSPKKSVHMFTSRGCPYNCVFCTVHKNKTIRYHSISRVMSEIEMLIRTLGADYIFMMDSLFTVTTKRLTEICEEILHRGLQFTWGCEGRVNFVAKHPEVLGLMKKAGCVHISYGIESGDQQVLNLAKKQITLEQVKHAVCYTAEAGIEPEGLFMLGLPGDTRESMQKTINLAKRLPFGYAQFAITTPFPGSELYYELVRQQKIDPYAWDQFSQYAALGGKNSTQIVYVPDGLSSEDIFRWQKKALREFYMRWKPIWRTIRNFRLTMIPELCYSGLIILTGRES